MHRAILPSIQVKIGLTLLISTTVVFFGFGLYEYLRQQTAQMNALNELAERVLERLADNLVNPLWTYDKKQIEKVILAELKEPSLWAVLIQDQATGKLQGKRWNDQGQVIDASANLTGDFLTKRKVIVRAEKQLGTVEIHLTYQFIRLALRQFLTSLAITVLILNLVLFLLLTLSLRLVLMRPLARLLRTANAMAEGDFSQELHTRQRDEIGALTRAFHHMRERIALVLNEMIGQVQAAADNVAGGSQTVHAEIAHLSHNTTEQAAAVEEITAAIEQMTANVHQNAANIAHTEKIARTVADDARQSRAAVLRTASSMNTIGQKIQMLEQIAQQTRMLSLNATIESARAHESGKGFAAVAAEVRSLAQRSHAATAEIEALVRSSTEIAGNAGDWLAKLAPDMQQTAELIRQISAASREQELGIEQINKTVQHMEQGIQTNAAAAERIAATVAHLTRQAETLRQTIAFFKKDKTGGETRNE